MTNNLPSLIEGILTPQAFNIHEKYFAPFFEKHFANYLHFAFNQELKNKPKAWIAFQRVGMRQVEMALSNLTADNLGLSTDIGLLKDQLDSLTQYLKTQNPDPQKDIDSTAFQALIDSQYRELSQFYTKFDQAWDKQTNDIALIIETGNQELKTDLSNVFKQELSGTEERLGMKIEEASSKMLETFYTYGEKKIKKYLSTAHTPEVFMGRDKELKTIHEKLFALDQQNENILLLVNGQGGIGKTTLAAKYYQIYQDEYKHLAWVFAESSLLNALMTLSIPLQMEYDPQMPDEERLDLLLAAMNNLGKPCLLVIDNANSHDDLEKYQGALHKCKNFHLLLTSRLSEFKTAAVYPIGPLSKEDAFKLFKTHYPEYQTNEDDLLAGILKTVGYNTLVIELLSKNLAQINTDLETHYSLANLFKDLEENSLLSLSQSEEVTVFYHVQGIEPRKATPEDIISAMYDLSELNKTEKKLLSIFAVLPAENIPYTVLKDLITDVERLDKQLKHLALKGWLDYDKGEKAFKTSPVIQAIVQEKNSDLLEDCEGVIEQLVDKLDYQIGVGHLLNATYEEAAFLVKLGASVLIQTHKSTGNLSVLSRRIGRYYLTIGNLNQSLIFFEKKQEMDEKLVDFFPEKSLYKLSLSNSYQYLGNIYSSLGNMEKCLFYYQKMNRLVKALYDADPTNIDFKYDLAVSYEKLGNTYRNTGKLEKALTFFEKETALFVEIYDADPTNIDFKNSLAIAYQCLGNIYSSLNNLEKSSFFYQEYYYLKKELYESFPMNVDFKNGFSVSCSKLGKIYNIKGEIEKSFYYYQESHHLMKALCNEYPTNVEFKHGLGFYYFKLGELYVKKGEKEKSIDHFLSCKNLYAELVEKSPSVVEFQSNYREVQDKLKALET